MNAIDTVVAEYGWEKVVKWEYLLNLFKTTKMISFPFDPDKSSMKSKPSNLAKP
jgi:hypothetical protein